MAAEAWTWALRAPELAVFITAFVVLARHYRRSRRATRLAAVGLAGLVGNWLFWIGWDLAGRAGEGWLLNTFGLDGLTAMVLVWRVGLAGCVLLLVLASITDRPAAPPTGPEADYADPAGRVDGSGGDGVESV